MTKITFEKASHGHKQIIFTWLEEPHIKEFWDNSQAHKDDIINFLDGRKTKSDYCDGLYTYWVGFLDNVPYAMIMTILEKPEYDIDDIKKAHLSKTGHTYCLDYMIGDKNYLGKGLGAKTLTEFTDFLKREVDNKVDVFMIDPEESNSRAKHVYEKAGFKHIGDFIMTGDLSGSGKMHHLLVKKILPIVSLVQATMKDYPIIQNMARFYVYDRSGYMGWGCEENGMFECIDFKHYFEDRDKKAFIVKVENELAGFILLDKETLINPIDWNLGEFFILKKFQNKAVGKYVAKEIFRKFHGKWLVAVMPQNIKALTFWRNVIGEVAKNNVTEIFKTAAELTNPDDMIIFSFEVN